MKRESWGKPMVTIWAWIWWRNDISVQALKEERRDLLPCFSHILGKAMEGKYWEMLVIVVMAGTSLTVF